MIKNAVSTQRIAHYVICCCCCCCCFFFSWIMNTLVTDQTFPCIREEEEAEKCTGGKGKRSWRLLISQGCDLKRGKKDCFKVNVGVITSVMNLLETFFLTYMSPQTYFIPSSSSCKQFFFPHFSVFFLFVVNITIAFLNYFSKDPLNITIATVYFVHIRSTLLFLIFGSDWRK